MVDYSWPTTRTRRSLLSGHDQERSQQSLRLLGLARRLIRKARLTTKEVVGASAKSMHPGTWVLKGGDPPDEQRSRPQARLPFRKPRSPARTCRRGPLWRWCSFLQAKPDRPTSQLWCSRKWKRSPAPPDNYFIQNHARPGSRCKKEEIPASGRESFVALRCCAPETWA